MRAASHAALPAGTPRLVVMLTLVCVSGCSLATAPLVTAPFVAPPTGAGTRGRLTLSTGGAYDSDQLTGGGHLFATGVAASLTLDLSRRYLLVLEGWGLSVGAEGDFLVLDRPKVRLGILHGLGVTFSAGNGCFTCLGARNDIGYLVDGGLLLEVDPGPKDALSLALRYAYRGDLASPPASAQDVGATIGWSRRIGKLRIGPEVAIAGDLPPSLGGPPVQDGLSFVVVAGVSLGGDF